MCQHTEAGTSGVCSAEKVRKNQYCPLSNELLTVYMRADNLLETIPNTVA